MHALFDVVEGDEPKRLSMFRGTFKCACAFPAATRTCTTSRSRPCLFRWRIPSPKGLGVSWKTARSDRRATSARCCRRPPTHDHFHVPAVPDRPLEAVPQQRGKGKRSRSANIGWVRVDRVHQPPGHALRRALHGVHEARGGVLHVQRRVRVPDREKHMAKAAEAAYVLVYKKKEGLSSHYLGTHAGSLPPLIAPYFLFGSVHVHPSLLYTKLGSLKHFPPFSLRIFVCIRRRQMMLIDSFSCGLSLGLRIHLSWLFHQPISY